MDINSIYSLNELIKYGKSNEVISFDKFCKYENGIINYNSIYDYIDILKNSSLTVQLNDEEYLKYSYKPKLLSYKVYGDPEYFYIILLINDITSAKEFNMKKIKLIDSQVLSSILSDIYSKL